MLYTDAVEKFEKVMLVKHSFSVLITNNQSFSILLILIVYSEMWYRSVFIDIHV